MDEYFEKQRLAEKIHEKARYFRGRFLNSVAVIERHLALFLTRYVCKTDPFVQELFFRQIAAKLTLENKRAVFLKIVEAHYPEFWNENKNTLEDLKKIMEFRNKLAHSIVDVSDDALRRPAEKGIGFIEWEQGKPITDSEFQDWEVRANDVISCVNTLEHYFSVPGKQLPNMMK